MDVQSPTAKRPRILFVPVSDPGGMGEYMRSLYIAEAARDRWPDADIRFVISREAPYVEEVPFPAFFTKKTPTRYIREVNRIVSEFRPGIVIFVSAGRAAQLRHASRQGSATVFVSQHRRKRRRGFKISRMRFTDLHWVVQPRFVDGDLSRWERAKLRIFGRPRVSFIGPVFPSPRAPRLDLPTAPYFLCCAGTGGLRVAGRNASELFAEEASRVAREIDMPGVMVMGPAYAGAVDSAPGLVVVPRLDGSEVVHVLAHAQFAMLAGGSILGQAVALGVPSVAAAVAKDQPTRIRAYEKEGLCLMAEPQRLARVTVERLTAEERGRQRQRMRDAGLRNGLDEAIEQLAELVEGGDVRA